MEKTQTRNMSAQLVPFLVLLGALFVVGLYVTGQDLRTDVKSAEQSLLPNETTNTISQLTVKYPDDWDVEETGAGFVFTPEDRDEDDEVLRIEFTILPLSLNGATSARGDVNFTSFPRRGTDLAAVAYKEEVPEETSPGRPERIDYVILVETGDGRTVEGTLLTNENDIDDYQEVFEGMARSIQTATIEPLELTEQLTSETTGISLTHPPEYTVGDDSQGALLLQIDPATQSSLQIIPGTLEQIAGQLIQSQPEEVTIATVIDQLFVEIPADSALTVANFPVEHELGDLSGMMGTLTAVNPQTNQDVFLDVGIFQYLDTPNHVIVILQSIADRFAIDSVTTDAILATVSIEEPAVDDTPEDAEDTGEAEGTDEGDTEGQDTEEDTQTSEDVEGTDAAEEIEEAVDSETAEEPAEDTEDAPDAATAEEAEEPAEVEVNFAETVTNEAGFSVGVPEGFAGEAAAEFVVLNRGNDEIRVAVVPQDELLGFLGNTLNLPVDELPSEDLAVTLLNELSGALPDAGEVVSENGTAYVDYAQFGEEHRVYMSELSEGNVIYADTAAFAQNADEVAAIMLATVDTVELTESAAAADDSEDAETSDTTDDTEETVDAAENDEATDDSEDDADASDDTSADDTEETVDAADTEDAEDTEDTEAATDSEEDAEAVADVTFDGTHDNEDAGFTISVPEGYEVNTVDGITVLEVGNSLINLEIAGEDELLDFINEKLGLELEELPNDDLAVNVMNRFADVQGPDVDDVSVVRASNDGNLAYVDVENLGRKSRYLIEVLEDGRVLYGQATALGQDFSDVGAALLAIVDDITFADE